MLVLMIHVVMVEVDGLHTNMRERGAVRLVLEEFEHTQMPWQAVNNPN